MKSYLNSSSVGGLNPELGMMIVPTHSMVEKGVKQSLLLILSLMLTLLLLIDFSILSSLKLQVLLFFTFTCSALLLYGDFLE